MLLFGLQKKIFSCISCNGYIALKQTSLHHLLLDKDAVCRLDKAASEAKICTYSMMRRCSFAWITKSPAASLLQCDHHSVNGVKPLRHFLPPPISSHIQAQS